MSPGTPPRRSQLMPFLEGMLLLLLIAPVGAVLGLGLFALIEWGQPYLGKWGAVLALYVTLLVVFGVPWLVLRRRGRGLAP